MTRWAAALAVAIMVAAVPAARACSVRPDYRVPTNLDLAAKGETIVIAEVIGQRPTAKRTNDFDSSVIVRPIQFLKGRLAPRLITIERSFLTDDLRDVTISPPRELRESNPDAWAGGCSRYTFRRGMKLVLFLTKDARGHFVPVRAPFARDSEDVTGPDALWVKAVREYAAISIAPPAEWNVRIRRRMAELRKRRGDADASAIARDMAVELKLRSQPRPPMVR